jgi:hypothetical protein
MDNEFKLLINDRIIWDCEEFTSIIKQSKSTIKGDTKMMLKVSDDDYVYLNGWKFNVHSTIYPGYKSNYSNYSNY